MLCSLQPGTSDRVPDITVAVATTTTPPPPQPAQRARRPTTLAYCEPSVAVPRVRRTKPPDISRHQPPPAELRKAAVVTVAAEVIAPSAVPPPPQAMRIVAPTATPEDSYVEDGSSSCGAELDALPVEQSSIADTATTLSTAAAVLTASSTAQRPDDDIVPDDRRTLETSCLDTQSIPEVARLSMTSSTDGATTQRPAAQRLVAMRRIHRAIAGARQRLLRQLGHRTVADEKPTATTAFSEDQAASSVTAVEDAASALTSSRSLLAVAGCSHSATVVAPMAAVEADVCSSVGSSTVALSDNGGSDAETLAGDVSLVVGGHRISPGSPSYDEKHARFSHVGAHALDVFYSPEDDDDDYEMSDRSDSGRAATSNSSLWRPLASCSGTLQEQSSTSMSLHVPTRCVAFADQVTSGLWLSSVPEAVRRPCVADDRSLSVQGLSADVIKPTLSLLEVLSPTEATGSSTLVCSDNCSTSAGADVSTIPVSERRFVVIFVSTQTRN